MISEAEVEDSSWPVLCRRHGLVVWSHRRHSHRLELNDVGRQFLRLPALSDAPSLQAVREAIHPDDLPRLVSAIRNSLRSRRSSDTPTRVLGSDRLYRSLLLRCTPPGAQGAHGSGLSGIGLDITEQIRGWRPAAEQAHRLEIAAEAAGLGLGSSDLNTGVVTWNAQMWALIGRAPQNAVISQEQWLNDVVHPGDREYLRLAPRRWSDPSAPAPLLEYRVVWPNGTERWLATRIVVIGSVVHGVTMDVTELYTARAEAKSTHEHFALLAQGAGVGSWEVTAATGQVTWDAQMCTLNGLDGAREAGVRAFPTEFALAEHTERITLEFAQAVQSRQPFNTELQVRWRDGSLHWLASRVAPMYDAFGRFERMFGVVWDVTEIKAAEAARRAKEEADAASRAKSELLTQVSHELRTPLNAILGFAQLLLADTPDNSPRRGLLQHILDGGAHLLALLNSVLDHASRESGRFSLALQAMALSDIVTSTVAMMEPLARRQGIGLETAAVHGRANADPTRVRQVLINLLGNAIKYNRTRGRVRVEGASGDDWVGVRIVDTGPGFTAEQLGALFEPYNRLGAEQSGVEGSGIGLVIVKSLLESMGGALHVQSQPGHGSSFEIRLQPVRWTTSAAVLAQQPPDAQDEPANTSADSQRRRSVLYIEDDEVSIVLFQHVAARVPHLDLRCTRSGGEGFAAAQALRPDLIVVDMQLSDMGGHEVLRQLRGSALTALTPCICLSAYALPQDVDAALAAGFAEYWTKPIDMPVLLASLTARLAGAEQAPQPCAAGGDAASP